MKINYSKNLKRTNYPARRLYKRKIGTGSAKAGKSGGGDSGAQDAATAAAYAQLAGDPNFE